MLLRLSSLLVLPLLVPPFAAGAPDGAGAAAVTTAVASPQDRGFIDLFLRAGLAAIESGRLAWTQSPQAAVRDFGRTLAQRQEETNRELAALAAPLHLPPLPDAPDGDDKTAADLLRQAGPERFDQQFLATQVRELLDLIRILEIEATTGDNLVLKHFATRLLPEVRDHLLQARTLAATLPDTATADPNPPRALARLPNGDWP